MHDIDDASVKQFFGELILDRLKAIEEYISVVPEMNQRLIRMEERSLAFENNLKATKAVIRIHDKNFRDIRPLYQQIAQKIQ